MCKGLVALGKGLIVLGKGLVVPGKWVVVCWRVCFHSLLPPSLSRIKACRRSLHANNGSVMNMQRNFDWVYRSGLVALAVLLGWSLWASAQTATNPAVATNVLPVVRNVPVVVTNVQAGVVAKTNVQGSTAVARKFFRVTKAASEAEVPEPERGYLTFGLDQIDPLVESKFLGVPLWQYLASLIYILLAFYAARFINFVTARYLRKWAEKSETRLDDLLLDLLQGPVKVIAFVVLLHIGLRVFTWPDWIEEWLSKGLQLVVAGSLTYMAIKLVDTLVGYWQSRTASETDRHFDEMLFPFLRKALKAFIFLVAVLITAQNLGLNITGLLASLSVGGLALGLGAQDTLGNMFGAVSIFLDKPFRIGDQIQLGGVTGFVESIGMRSTRLRNLEGHLVTIPNKQMGTATIVNISRRPNIKTELNLGLTQTTSQAKLKRALALLEEVYRKHPKTHDVWISFNKFTDSTLNLYVIHWWMGDEMKDYLAGMQELNLAIKERFEQEHIEFAFPTQTLYVKQEQAGKG